jgi:hypothetical protein
MAQAPFVLTPALVAIVNNYANVNMTARGYIQDQVVPRVTVDAPLFRYPEYPIEEAFTVYDDQVGRLDRLNEIVESATEQTGAVIDHGLLEKIPFRDMMAAENQSIPFSLKARAARNVVDKVQLNREIRVASLITTPANYQVGYKVTLAGTAQWSDFVNSDPVAVVNDAAASMLIPPNVAVMSKAVRNILRRHPKVSVALGGSQESGRYVTDAELAQALGVERIIIGNTLRATTKRGQALTTGQIWGKHLALLYIPPVNSGDGTVIDAASPAFALTFQWGGKVSGELAYRPGEMGLWGGVGVLTGESLVEKLVAPFAGYFFENAIA